METRATSVSPPSGSPLAPRPQTLAPKPLKSCLGPSQRILVFHPRGTDRQPSHRRHEQPRYRARVPIPEGRHFAPGGGLRCSNPSSLVVQSGQEVGPAPGLLILFHFAELGCDRAAAGSKLALRNACPGLELWVSPASRDVRSVSPSFLRNLALHGYERALENREV